MSLTDLLGNESNILKNKQNFTDKRITELDDEIDEDYNSQTGNFKKGKL